MQRSEIRGHPIRIAIPGLRCASSGLRRCLTDWIGARLIMAW